MSLRETYHHTGQLRYVESLAYFPGISVALWRIRVKYINEKLLDLIGWYLGHTPPLHKISSESSHNLPRHTVKHQFMPYFLSNESWKMIQDPQKKRIWTTTKSCITL